MSHSIDDGEVQEIEFPVWAITEADSETPVGMNDASVAWYMAVFTDAELADTFIDRSGLQDKIALEVPTAEQMVEILQEFRQRLRGENVGIDIYCKPDGGITGTFITIEEALEMFGNPIR